MLRIPAEVEKGGKDRLHPLTPDFAAHLDSVPEAQRRGRVFKLLTADGKALRASGCEISRIAAAIGKAANVVVDERQKRSRDDAGEVVETTARKFASCHDLRRAFAVRWAAKLHPTQLRELMRHASIATTLTYYVGADAEAAADAIWEAFVDTSVDTRAQRKSAGKRRRLKEAAKQAI